MGGVADVSLCIICRDDADNLRRLVTEARPWIKEIIVVDTASSDGSPQVAREAGADIVVERPDLIHEDGIIRSFAEARNVSYALATRPWQLWLDTDDTFGDRWSLVQQVVQEASLARSTQSKLSVKLKYDYVWTADRNHCVMILEHDRFTHQEDGWRWTRPIHEHLTCGDENNPSMTNSELRVIHLSSGARGRANDRNFKILKRWEASRGLEEDPVTIRYYLGDELFHRKRYDEAFDCFQKMAGLETNMQVSGALKAARCLMLQGRFREMCDYMRPLMQTRPNIANFYWDIAYAHLMAGNVTKARAVMEHSKRAFVQVTGESTRPRDVVLAALAHQGLTP